MKSGNGITIYLWALLMAAPLVFAVPGSEPFKPKSFSSDEFHTLTVLTEAIMPSGEYPGAREAKVSQFIDLQLVYDADLQKRFRRGLKWLDEKSHARFGRRFVQLNARQRGEILDHLRFKALQDPKEGLGQDFYRLARRYTEMGFYSSRAGLKVLKAPVDSKSPAEKIY